MFTSGVVSRSWMVLGFVTARRVAILHRARGVDNIWNTVSVAFETEFRAARTGLPGRVGAMPGSITWPWSRGRWTRAAESAGET